MLCNCLEGNGSIQIILLFLHMRFGIYMTVAGDNVVITQNFPNILH